MSEVEPNEVSNESLPVRPRGKYIRPTVEKQVLFVLEKLFATGEAIHEGTLYRYFAKASQAKARKVISELLTKGFIHRIGSGKSSKSRVRFIPSLTWQLNRCPFCDSETDTSKALLAGFDYKYRQSPLSKKAQTQEASQ